jgi:hypothetical protein
VNALTQAIMVEALLTAPRSINQLVEITGLAREPVSHYLRALRHKKVLYRAAWGEDAIGRPVVEEYMIGIGQRDCPPTDTRTQRQRKNEQQRVWRSRQRALKMVHALAGQSVLVPGVDRVSRVEYNPQERIEQ